MTAVINAIVRHYIKSTVPHSENDGMFRCFLHKFALEAATVGIKFPIAHRSVPFCYSFPHKLGQDSH